MSIFSVRIDKLNEAADKYNRVITKIDEQSRNYNALIQDVDNSWDGLASIAFVRRMRGEASKLMYMRKYTVALRNYCKTTAERMEAIDGMLRKIMEMLSAFWGTISGGNDTEHGGGGAQIPADEKEQDSNLYTYGGQAFSSIPNFTEYVWKQDTGYNCTSFAWCMGRSMYTGQYCDPHSSEYWGENGARYTGYGSIINSNQFSALYNEISQGKPAMFYGHNGNNVSGKHAVTVVGIRDGANAAALTADDFLCIDPGDGKIKKLTEVGYQHYNGTVYTYA